MGKARLGEFAGVVEDSWVEVSGPDGDGDYEVRVSTMYGLCMAFLTRATLAKMRNHLDRLLAEERE